MGEPIEIEGWEIEGETARIRADRYTADGVHLLMEDWQGHEMDSLHVPEAVVAALLRNRGWTVEEPDPKRALLKRLDAFRDEGVSASWVSDGEGRPTLAVSWRPGAVADEVLAEVRAIVEEYHRLTVPW